MILIINGSEEQTEDEWQRVKKFIEGRIRTYEQVVLPSNKEYSHNIKELLKELKYDKITKLDKYDKAHILNSRGEVSKVWLGVKK